jgi:hypothetical protein
MRLVPLPISTRQSGFNNNKSAQNTDHSTARRRSRGAQLESENNTKIPQAACCDDVDTTVDRNDFTKPRSTITIAFAGAHVT